jgi:hypothetical protein
MISTHQIRVNKTSVCANFKPLCGLAVELDILAVADLTNQNQKLHC